MVHDPSAKHAFTHMQPCGGFLLCHISITTRVWAKGETDTAPLAGMDGFGTLQYRALGNCVARLSGSGVYWRPRCGETMLSKCLPYVSDGKRSREPYHLHFASVFQEMQSHLFFAFAAIDAKCKSSILLLGISHRCCYSS
jgi:hypothetical protein